MSTQISLYDLLLMLGLIQGIITVLLLWFSKRNRYSNRFLALSILAFCLLTVKMLLHSLALRDILLLRYLPIGVELLIAPLMYFYIHSLVTPNFKWKPSNWLHFIPFFLSQGYSILIYVLTIGEQSIPPMDRTAEILYFNTIKNTEDYLAVISIVIYLVLSYSKLKQYRTWLKNSISDNTAPGFGWLRNVFVLCSILGVYLILNLSLDFFFDLQSRIYYHWQLYYLFISALIYYFGIIGFMQPEYHLQIASELITAPIVAIKLPENEIERIRRIILKAMENDKAYLDPVLNAKKLAEKIGVSQSNLSYVVNHSFKRSFRDLINDYRIEAVKVMLKDPSSQHMSILGIALECGFNSEASFYRIFKRKTGVSPKEFIQK